MKHFAKSLLVSSALCALPLCPAHAEMDVPALKAAIEKSFESDYPKLDALYKDIHAHPELAFQEVKTAAKLAAEMRALGFEVTEKVGRTGLVAIYKNGDGPTILVRTDMDALPIVENTGLPYASHVKVKRADGSEVGVMHACGHDVHMSVFLGTARMLAQHTGGRGPCVAGAEHERRAVQPFHQWRRGLLGAPVVAHVNRVKPSAGIWVAEHVRQTLRALLALGGEGRIVNAPGFLLHRAHEQYHGGGCTAIERHRKAADYHNGQQRQPQRCQKRASVARYGGRVHAAII